MDKGSKLTVLYCGWFLVGLLLTVLSCVIYILITKTKDPTCFWGVVIYVIAYAANRAAMQDRAITEAKRAEETSE